MSEYRLSDFLSWVCHQENSYSNVLVLNCFPLIDCHFLPALLYKDLFVCSANWITERIQFFLWFFYLGVVLFHFDLTEWIPLKCSIHLVPLKISLFVRNLLVIRPKMWFFFPSAAIITTLSAIISYSIISCMCPCSEYHWWVSLSLVCMLPWKNCTWNWRVGISTKQ